MTMTMTLTLTLPCARASRAPMRARVGGERATRAIAASRARASEAKGRARDARERGASTISHSSSNANDREMRSSANENSQTMVKVCELEDLPRGERKLVRAFGKSVLMFWYRDRVYAIESRSPAEGAYSQGFERARLTQDGCIECPTTKSTFDLQTGEIKEWYPDNNWLAWLTPRETCRAMEVFPIEMKQDGIYLDAKNGSLGPDFVAPVGFGGSNTSLENNNVFGVEPAMWVEGEERGGARVKSSTDAKIDPGQLGGVIAAAAAVAVAGSAACLYYENYIALGVLWIVGFAAAAAVALKTTGALDDE